MLEAFEHTVYGTHCERGYGLAGRQTLWMKVWKITTSHDCWEANVLISYQVVGKIIIIISVTWVIQ